MIRQGKSFQFLNKLLPFVGCPCIEFFGAMKGKIPTGQRMTADLYLFSEASGSRRGSATPLKTNMTMEKQPFQDVSPTKHGDFPASHVSFRGSIGW